jgi:hypothetical protein
VTNDVTTDWTGVIHCGGYDGITNELTRMHEKVSALIDPDDPHPPQTAYYTVDVTGEYTDEDLRNYILSQMPAYTGWFQAGAGEVIAYSLIAGNHVDGGSDCWGGPARLGKMKFRFGVPDSEAGAQYRVTWDLIPPCDRQL